MYCRRFLLAMFTSLTLANFTWAEKAPLTPAQLGKTATHVITGHVTDIYDRTETVGNWKYTRYVAEIRVVGCEKGKGVQKGDLVYARYWRRSWIGAGRVPPSTAGHRGLPSDGDTLRVYLARNAYDGFTRDNKDGGFNVIGANGFAEWKPTPSK